MSLKAGFSRVNITPKMGIEIAGYFNVRVAEGVLDELEINALALECNGKRAVMMCADHLGICVNLIKKYKAAICKKTGLSEDEIFISATHTHTAPKIDFDEPDEITKEYIDFLGERLCDAAVAALADLKPAKMGYGTGIAPNVAFVRRFRMKDGSIATNPGVNNPDIVEPIGEVDERVHVLRFDREGGETVVLVNFGNHPDIVGGCKISADWPGMLRKNTEKALDNVKCIFFNGAQGDVNHVNVHPTGGYLNDLFMDFDDVARGYSHANYVSRVVLGGVLQSFDKVKYVEVDKIGTKIKEVAFKSNKADPKELPEAHRINDLHLQGRDSELPYSGMMLTTVVAEAGRMVRLENAPDTYELPLTCLSIGPVAFLGIPGEPFTGIGKGLKKAEGFELIMPVCIANGYEGYYPMMDSYTEGGYEARSSNFKAGVAERMIEEGSKLIKEMSEI